MVGIRLEEQGTLQNNSIVKLKHPKAGDRVDRKEESPYNKSAR